MELKEWQIEVDEWIKTIGVRYFDPLTNMAMLMEEVGELSRHMARQYGEQSYKKTLTEKQQKEQLEEELGDVFFVLTCLANQLDINIDQVLRENLVKKSSRDHNRHKENPKLS